MDEAMRVSDALQALDRADLETLALGLYGMLFYDDEEFEALFNSDEQRETCVRVMQEFANQRDE